MATARGGLYFMFLGPPSPKFLDTLLVLENVYSNYFYLLLFSCILDEGPESSTESTMPHKLVLNMLPL